MWVAHLPPYSLGHCAFCDFRLSINTPAPVQELPKADCKFKGDNVPLLELARVHLDTRKVYNRCGQGLGFPAGIVCSCFCGPYCKSFVEGPAS
jgi:hypothetical protein